MKCTAYDEYKPSYADWLGDVPSHWVVKAIKWESPVLRGASPRPIDDPIYFDDDGEYAWVRISDVSEAGAYLESTEQKLSDVGARLSVKLKPSDLFLSIAGSVGKPCITRIKCCIHDGFVYFPRWKTEPKFLYYLFASGEPYKGLGKMGTQLNLNTDTVGSIIIGLPGADEQQTIVRFLDAKTAQIDTLVAKKLQLIDKLKEKRSALIARTVTRGLPPEAAKAARLEPNPEMKDSGVEWLGLIPSHWGVKRLRHIGEAVIGLTYEPGDISDEEDGTLVLRSSNVQEGKITLDDNVYVKKAIPKHLRTRAGDILICSRNGSRALIGKNAKIDRRSEGMTFGAFMTVFRSEMSEYLYWVFNSDLFTFQSGAFLTSTINQLTVSNLYSFAIALPPADEQRHICEYLENEVSALDLLISKVDKAISRLTEYRQALITSAVTGKIDVREAVA